MRNQDCGIPGSRRLLPGIFFISFHFSSPDSSLSTNSESPLSSIPSRLLLLLLPRPYCHNIPANMYAPYRQLWLAISWSSYATIHPVSRKYCSSGYHRIVAFPHVYRQHNCSPTPFGRSFGIARHARSHSLQFLRIATDPREHTTECVSRRSTRTGKCTRAPVSSLLALLLSACQIPHLVLLARVAYPYSYLILTSPRSRASSNRI